jgi:predicted DNA-binding transcriptional regulator YafY
MSSAEPHDVPPVDLTAQEAAAVAVALSRAGETPFGLAAQTALAKVLAAMSASEVEATRAVADRVRLVVHGSPEPAVPVPSVVADAIVASRVLVIDYEDAQGVTSRRWVEPGALVVNADVWYLVAHCRLRDARRAFRLDRITRALLTDEPAPVRVWDDLAAEIPGTLLEPPVTA